MLLLYLFQSDACLFDEKNMQLKINDVYFFFLCQELYVHVTLTEKCQLSFHLKFIFFSFCVLYKWKCSAIQTTGDNVKEEKL